jgi:Cellulase (glycosyl hydrolase family 5)
LVRFDLEAYSSAAYPKGGRRVDGQWKNILQDPAYFTAIQQIVRHMTAKGAYVLVSEWLDPTTTETELPTAQTNREWDLLARAFADDPRVLYGLVNEPHDAPANDAAAFSALNAAVQTIRDAENAIGAKHHIVSVPGVDGYARNVAYYVDHPITAGGGANIVYEIHVYNSATEFQNLFVAPAAKIPILIGEFGPSTNPPMSFADITTMMETAEKLEVPYIAWNFHANCPPNLLQSTSDGGSCGIGMPLVPTPDWGMLIKNRFATPW